MSPGEAGEATCFTIRRGTGVRLDASFNHPRYEAINARLDAAPVPTPELNEFLESIAGGATPSRSNAALYTDSGVKFLRILNVVDGEILDRDMKFIVEGVHTGALNRSQLASDDVLMTITGRVGSAAVVGDSDLPGNINQHIARLRVDKTLCKAAFLSEWLNCPAGLDLSSRLMKNASLGNRERAGAGIEARRWTPIRSKRRPGSPLIGPLASPVGPFILNRQEPPPEMMAGA